MRGAWWKEHRFPDRHRTIPYIVCHSWTLTPAEWVLNSTLPGRLAESHSPWICVTCLMLTSTGWVPSPLWASAPPQRTGTRISTCQSCWLIESSSYLHPRHVVGLWWTVVSILFSLSHLWGADKISFHPPRKAGRKQVPQKGWRWPWDRFIRLASRLLSSVVSWSFHQQLHQRRQGDSAAGQGKEWTEQVPLPAPPASLRGVSDPSELASAEGAARWGLAAPAPRSVCPGPHTPFVEQQNRISS